MESSINTNTESGQNPTPGATAPQLNSPIQFPMSGQDFSPEDIQALLAGVEPEQVVGNFQQQEHEPSSKRVKLSPQEAAPASSCPVEQKTMDRTERKRRLEKQRRSDVNQQFQKLQSVLKELESDNCDPLHGLPAYSPASRVELMARTCALLTNYHAAHKKLKAQTKDLQEQLAAARKAGEETAAKVKENLTAPQSMGGNKIMMMVPMVIGGNNGEGHSGMPFMQPYMPTDSNSAAPWGMMNPMMMPPWMMPTMGAPPNMNHRHPTNNTSTNQGKTDRSSSSSSSSSGSTAEMGGNLAHCA